MRKRRQNHSLLVMLALIHVHLLLILHLVSYTPWSLASLGFSFSTIMWHDNFAVVFFLCIFDVLGWTTPSTAYSSEIKVIVHQKKFIGPKRICKNEETSRAVTVSVSAFMRDLFVILKKLVEFFLVVPCATLKPISNFPHASLT